MRAWPDLGGARDAFISHGWHLPTEWPRATFTQRVHAELFFRPGAVCLHCFQAQMQVAGDLRRSAALAEKAKDLQFAIT